VAIPVIGETNAALPNQGSSIASRNETFPAPPRDGVPLYFDPLGGKTPYPNRQDVERATEEMAGAAQQNCQKILPGPGTVLLREGLPTPPSPIMGFGRNDYGLRGPYRLERHANGSFTFTEPKAGPPGAKNNVLTIKPDGEVSFAPGGKPIIAPGTDLAERHANATYNMLKIFVAATQKHLDDPPGTPVRFPKPVNVSHEQHRRMMRGLENQINLVKRHPGVSRAPREDG
jgi:hypothetical protein